MFLHAQTCSKTVTQLIANRPSSLTASLLPPGTPQSQTCSIRSPRSPLFLEQVFIPSLVSLTSLRSISQLWTAISFRPSCLTFTLHSQYFQNFPSSEKCLRMHLSMKMCLCLVCLHLWCMGHWPFHKHETRRCQLRFLQHFCEILKSKNSFHLMCDS